MFDTIYDPVAFGETKSNQKTNIQALTHSKTTNKLTQRNNSFFMKC